MARWLKVILFALGVVGLALATLPWWLGAALRPILHTRGVTFEKYERIGYAHFRLRQVDYQSPGIRVTAQSVETVTPLVWVGQRLRGAEPALKVEGWQVIRSSGAKTAAVNAAQPTVSGLPDLQAAVRRVTPRIAYWLPRAQLSDGELIGFGPVISITSVAWRDAALTVEGLRVSNHVLAFVIAPAADGAITLAAHTAGDEAKLQLTWTGSELKGDATLWTQPLQLAARFPAQGWLPTEASLVAANWQLPAARVKLGAPYAQVHGDARLLWRDGAFDLSFNAKAEPAADTKTKAPPFEASGTAHGTRRELTLTALAVNAPFATAKLTAPVTFSLDRPLAAESAELNVAADLAKLPWLAEARGLVQGTVRVNGGTAAARQIFQLNFSDVVLPGFALQKAQAAGVLRWPLLELTSLDVQLDETSRVQAHGSVDWQTRELSGGALQAKLTPGWFTRWLPAGTTWGSATVTATMAGPLAAPRHQGSLKLTDAQRPPLHPLLVDVSWQGTGTKTEILSARIAASHSALVFSGTLDPQGLQLDNLSFTASDQPVWQLAAPARLTWAPVWQIDQLQLSGASSSLTLKGQGGPEGFIDFNAAHFESAWLQDWVTLTGPAWQLQTWQTTGRVADRVLVFDTTLTAQIAMSPKPAQVKLVARGDADGLQLKELTVVETDRVLTQASGRLPLTWRMEPTPQLRFDEAAPLELTASTEPDSPLWASLSAASGLQLTRPTAKINLQGSLREPTGDLQLRVAKLRVATTSQKFSLPDFEDLTLDLQLAREQVTLSAFSARLDGQAVQASGRVPMNDVRWQELWRAPAAFEWREIEAKLEIPDADLAPLARHAPNFFAARGRLRAHVELNRGKFSGELHLADAATRPLPPFGTLQEINADLALDERTLTIRSLTAKLGSEPVALDGSITFVPDAPPRLSLGLKGANLPLVRNTGLLVRSDLDLHAKTDSAGLTRLTGRITLRDSLVLANFNTLLPNGPRGVTRQPPYFAVEAEPFRHWPLDVEVRGPGAIRLRTTVFNGTATARFRLGGTLGEPRAVGDLTVDQGQVLFPFATFRVQQGIVRLSEADPFHARINLVAASQRRDYQLRLEVTGQLPEPNLTLSSSPALEAEEVLLLVMTGQPPTGEASSSGAQRFALLGAYLGRGIFQDLGVGGENRLEISAGQQVSAQGRETYEIEYKLRERWSLVGEYDEYDSYNAGVKWRVYTQESVPVENEKK